MTLILLHLHLLVIHLKSWSPASGRTFPVRTCCQDLLLPKTLKVGPLVVTENMSDCKFSAEFVAITAPYPKNAGEGMGTDGWGRHGSSEIMKVIYAIWFDAIKFTMENISNHSFYVVIFRVFCKWNLIAHHKWFCSDHISYSGQLLTFPVCLKET